MPAPLNPDQLSRRQRAVIGGGLAMLIISSWLVLHLLALFLLQINWWTLLLVPLLTWLSVGLFIVSHDAMHGTLLPGLPRLNRGLGALAAALYANFSYRSLYASHMRHHAQPGTEGDPDFHAGAPTRFWPWFLTFMQRYFCLREWLLMVARIAIYLALGASILNIICFYAVPAWLSALQLFYFGTYRPHRHDDAQFADSHNARSAPYPGWLSLLTCFHFGYHHEHHLSPGTPWWRLPSIRSGKGA